MAWTDVPDFTVGQVLTSSRMNQMRNNDNIGHRVCTSTTRPASPDAGTMIYESDTNKAYVWTGAAWIEVLSENTRQRSNTTQMPAGSVVQVARYPWTTATSVNGVGAGWVTAASSTTNFTPLFANSKVWIVGELAMAPYYPGGGYAGMTCRITWRGNVVTVQNQTHEVYTANSNDLYSRTIKTAWTDASSATSGAITTQVAAYLSTTEARLNQSGNWESSYTILEIRQ